MSTFQVFKSQQELTTVSYTCEAGVMRLRESAESWRGVLRGGGAEQRLLWLLHGGRGHVCWWETHTRGRAKTHECTLKVAKSGLFIIQIQGV